MQLYTLTNKNGLIAKISNYGAIAGPQLRCRRDAAEFAGPWSAVCCGAGGTSATTMQPRRMRTDSQDEGAEWQPSGTSPRAWRCSNEGRDNAVIDAQHVIPDELGCLRIYGRNSLVTLMTNARVDSSDQRSPGAPVFRSSVYTTNSSLPGAHSQRSRKFPLTV